ncbi:hypothetical protein K437DRAFT_262374 [Tilletiaria anomala UBC 951]|uniref:Uncharacterized protein n=1 Tax=Tilletiaria anomala (strain ATCC 24038 / CBS 436.72 / UBC 951) TaxID=1037660 RepID=A0A066W9G4_TILAU|nr:uncharacterized protein K437DRAFT_262374 [Tilletiaria anomala UBC 951]KDN47724.1 hypothetical protein K437DRAFT_262374 [Tilletiaria anomala UBC 951]
MAIAGYSELSVSVLPRSGWMNNSSSTTSVKALPIGKFYHNRGSSKIAKIDWHPWARGGSSLLVLTEDGVLREYDVSVDHEEPAQQLSFLPNASALLGSSRGTHASASKRLSTRSPPIDAGRTASTPDRSRRQETPGFLANRVAKLGLRDEPEAQIAVSFAFGAGVFEPPPDGSSAAHGTEGPMMLHDSHVGAAWGGWAPLEIHAVMQNGDIWTVCPFLPSQAMVPPSYISHLASYVDLQADTASEDRSRDVDLALRYVRSLARQASAAQSEANATTMTPAQTPASSRQRSLLPPDAGRSASFMSIDTPAPGEDSLGETLVTAVAAQIDTPVLITPPHLPLSPVPKPIGPHLLQPAPHELSDEREPLASDLAITRLTDDDGHSIDVVCVALDDGRVDVCLTTGRAASWQPTAFGTSDSGLFASGRVSRKSWPRRSGCFKLSDSEESEDSEDPDTRAMDTAELNSADKDVLPTLLVYESIDLTLPPAGTGQIPSAPALVVDPIYPDTVYAYSAAGVHAISFRPWAAKLAALTAKLAQNEVGADEELGRFMRRRIRSELVQVIKSEDDAGAKVVNAQAIIGVSILSDVYLSYALLAVTADLQPVGIELDFRVETNASLLKADENTGLDTERGQDGKKAYISLLEEGGAFIVPEPFASYGGLPSQPKITGQHRFGKSEVVVTPDSLRFLGNVSESLRGNIRDIIQGGNAVQARLELQQKELARQLGKLSDVQSKNEALNQNEARISRRFDDVEATQAKLNKCIDTLLQRLIVLHQPEISIYERKWFDELDRLAADFGVSLPGGTAQGEKLTSSVSPTPAITRKIEALRSQLELIRPGLWELKEAQQAREETKNTLGTAQMSKISRALAKQSSILLEAKSKAQDMLTKIGHAHAASSL